MKYNFQFSILGLNKTQPYNCTIINYYMMMNSLRYVMHYNLAVWILFALSSEMRGKL